MKWLIKSVQIIGMSLLVQTCYAQLGFCTGNSGNPIFTETFGTGIGQSALPAGTTTYTYANGVAPNDGFYAVSNTSNYFDWFIVQDHTPNDTNGKMLVINSDFTSGEFYRTSINGLCANTSYEFSSWLINLTPSTGFCGAGAIPINVSFEIWDTSDTNLLASGSTGAIVSTPSSVWRQYGLVFQTLAGQTSVILKMKNNGAGGCGNDLAIDDIVFKSCGDDVVITNTPGANRFEACEEDTVSTVLLTATPDFSVFSTHAYQWQVSTDNINWNDIPAAMSDTYDAPAPTPSGILYYRVKFAEIAGNLQNASCNSLSESFEIKINALETPTFDAITPICDGDSFTFPSISTNNITGTWSPVFNNTATTTYTFTPSPGQCATSQTLTVTVNQPITPTFNPIGPICNGDMLNLPTTSTNNINGTWSPTANNAATTTYTFTPNVSECATIATLTVVVNQPITPNFDAVPPICSGATLSPLPTTSLNNIVGSWSPAINNTSTTTYTFTPNAGQCASIQTLTIVINQPTIPTFNSVSDICMGDNLMTLPTTSTNNISGTWSPALDNTTTTTYTFTPNIGQCATAQTITIVVNPLITPSFSSIPPICSGDSLSSLPTISLNNITGTWSPALNNTTTTLYTFTPNAQECATSQTLLITVNQSITPLFDPVAAICFGEILSQLPTTSTNNITGTWSPELDNTTTTTYTFTPEEGQCPILAMLTIVVNQKPMVDLDSFYSICANTNGTEIFESSLIATDLSESEYSFVWTNSAGDIVGTDASYVPLIAGDYSVVVTDLLTGCQNEDSTTVVESSPPVLNLISNSEAFATTETLGVSTTGNGIYEYSLDNGTWQDSPIFTNVNPGNHTVIGRDKNGCGYTTIDVCLIGAPKFFTPNGDGINETWNIQGLSCIDNANIFIYDRFGKLLKQINASGDGWNGRFNGHLLPSDDYWFVVRYFEFENINAREYKGHFTLKR